MTNVIPIRRLPWIKPYAGRIAVFTMTNEGPLIMVAGGRESLFYRACLQWNRK